MFVVYIDCLPFYSMTTSCFNVADELSSNFFFVNNTLLPFAVSFATEIRSSLNVGADSSGKYIAFLQMGSAVIPASFVQQLFLFVVF